MSTRALRASSAAFILLTLSVCPSQAQAPDPAAPPPAASPETELNIVNLPTTLSLRRHQSYFRLTHRFARDLRPSVFVTGELTPRLAGHDPGRGTWGVSVEKRTRGGGHTMQLNFTNSFGTTFGQLARGGSDHDVYLGFNITRKF